MSVATGRSPYEMRGVTHQMCDPRAPNLFLLGRQAMLGQEPPIHRRSTTAVRRSIAPYAKPVTCHPSTAKDQDFKLFWLRHELPPCATLDLFRNLPVTCVTLTAIGDSLRTFLALAPSSSSRSSRSKRFRHPRKKCAFFQRCAGAIFVSPCTRGFMRSFQLVSHSGR